MEHTGQTSKADGRPVAFLLKSLLFSYILTGVMLALLAFLLYKLGIRGHHRDLCGSHAFRRICGREEDGQPQVPLGAPDGERLFSGIDSGFSVRGGSRD